MVRHPRSDESGFTLIELIVVIIIISILGATAIPQMTSMRISMNRMSARSYLLQDLKRAQAETIEQGCRGIVKVAADGASYTFGCDYLSYDVAADPSADLVAFTRYLPDEITVTANAPIIFNSRGQSIDTAYIISNVNLTLTDSHSGSSNDFATGTIAGTGVFSYD